MENQEQVQPRRSQRQRKPVDRLQLEGIRESKPLPYRELRRVRLQKAAKKRKRALEEIQEIRSKFENSLDSQQKSKKAKFQETKKDDKRLAEPKNYDDDCKFLCIFCEASDDDLPSADCFFESCIFLPTSIPSF
jgi:hypothetical protein